MLRWRIAWVTALLAALRVLMMHSGDTGLLLDSDTHVLLQTIRARNAPFSWFLGDWPLYNHFYRPIPTLAFELDSRLYGNNAAGFGWTNAILAAGCVLALFWFLREFVNRPLASVLATLLFAFWQTGDLGWLSTLAWWGAGVTLLVGITRHRRNWKAYIPASLVLVYLSHELVPIEFLGGRMLDWLPGRTASCMTLFALGAMAAYSRYERLGKRHAKPEPPTPLTPPATKSATQTDAEPPIRRPWALLAIILAAGAFASYEQAVMLPACLLAVAVAFRWLHYRPTWTLQVAFWALLLGYLELRHQIIPSGVSSYQRQQLRTTVGAMNSLEDFVYPIGLIGISIEKLLEWSSYLFADPYLIVLHWLSFAAAIWALRKEWIYAVTGLGLSILAFLPMAWLHLFDHYYYWPLALRTIFVIALGTVAWRLTSTAWCLPELQAPPRLSPAPGSLPRP